jgi:NAD-dependent SIR2 family protein deacetylase
MFDDVEYELPNEIDYYTTFTYGENDEVGCRSCDSVFSLDMIDEDEQRHCSKCMRIFCPYCDVVEVEEKEEHSDSEDSDNEKAKVLCLYCATGRLSVNDLGSAFIVMAHKKGISVSALYERLMR